MITALPFFKDLPDAVSQDLNRVCASRTFGKNEMIYFQGDTKGKVFLVLGGEVKLYFSQAGQRIVIQVFTPGEFFGDLTFMNHPSSLALEDYAQATQETKVCSMNSADLSRLLEKHASFAMALLVALRNRLHQTESKIRDIALSSAPTRLLNELIRYAVHRGKERKGLYEIEERLTHQSLADMSGMARETVTKTLGDLEKNGFISHDSERRIRLNIEKITKECVECLSLAA